MVVRLHVGTSGWSYKHWNGLFYPGNLKPAKYLEYYFTKFDCVELNSSFYHLPLKTTVEGWLNRTPDQFIFCPKLSRYITHQLRLLNTREPLSRFFEVFDALKLKTGPVLIQLPPGLPFDQVRTEEFIGILTEKYRGYRFAIEIRHKSWLNEVFFTLLEKTGIALVFADSGNRYPYYERLTTDFVYIRFHGNGQLYASDYSDAELDFYSGKIGSWLAEKKEVWVFFNNDIHGYALNNALKLKEFTELKTAGYTYS